MSGKYSFIPFEFPKSKDGKYTEILDEAHVFRSRREQLGLTQQQVAELAGIQVPQYQRLESEERPLSGCSMRIGLSICAVLYLDPYDFVHLDVKLPDSNSMKSQVKFDDVHPLPKVGRKQIDHGLMTVYANYEGDCLLVPYTFLNYIGKPKFVKFFLNKEENRALLVPAEHEDEETLGVPEPPVIPGYTPIYSIHNFKKNHNLFSYLNWGTQPQKIEVKLVHDQFNMSALLINLNSAKPINELPSKTFLVYSHCLSR